ncbi:hypothetical protein BGZ79_005550 [Entomortierella chlamydospora]|nr:hypothetical protein BGZ79_005550 [Entomortierella chlamydospora]
MDTRATRSASPLARDMVIGERELSPSFVGEPREQQYISTRLPSEAYSSKPANTSTVPRSNIAHVMSGHDARTFNSASVDQDQSFQQFPQYNGNQQQSYQPVPSYRENLRGSSGYLHLQGDPPRMYTTERQSYQQPSSRRSNIPQGNAGIQDTNTSLFDGQQSASNAKRRVTKEKLPKGDREEVWPPDVESAFMKALEVLPKLGRRKVLVNGKPCGRNELIADFIFQETQKVRDRKQVSSHIQVLKNTRKHDVAFMRLLMDSGDGDEDGATETANTGYTSTSHSPVPSLYMEHDREGHNFDERASQPNDTTIISLVSTSIADNSSSYNSYSSHPSLRGEFNQRQNHYRVRSFTVSDIPSDHIARHDRPKGRASSVQPLYRQTVATPDTTVSLYSETGGNDQSCGRHIEDRQSGSMSACDLSSIHRELFRIAYPPRPIYSSFSFWPTEFRLFLHCSRANEEWDKENDLSRTEIHIHELARAQDLRPHEICDVDIRLLGPGKFPGLYDLYEKESCAFLYLKIGVNLNLELEGTFENTCIFESDEPRSVRCITLTYSFGAKVLESSEIKQVTFANGKIVHSFELVNQFFDAFLSGIKTLETIDEVEVALSNLSLIQIYEDLEPQEEGGRPLLVTVSDFERGHGSVTPYAISHGRNA